MRTIETLFLFTYNISRRFFNDEAIKYQDKRPGQAEA